MSDPRISLDNRGNGIVYAYLSGFSFPHDRVGPEPTEAAALKLAEWTLAHRDTDRDRLSPMAPDIGPLIPPIMRHVRPWPYSW